MLPKLLGIPILGRTLFSWAPSTLLIVTRPPPGPATPPAALSIEVRAAFRIDSNTFLPVSGPCPVKDSGDSGVAEAKEREVNLPRDVNLFEPRTPSAAERAFCEFTASWPETPPFTERSAEGTTVTTERRSWLFVDEPRSGAKAPGELRDASAGISVVPSVTGKAFGRGGM
jgi:hypothetical protein